MYQPDRFEEPTYSGQKIEFEDEGISAKLGGAADPVKKYLKYIIALVVIAAVAWFLYDFFIGSVLTAAVIIENTEGEAVSSNTIKIFAEGASEPFFSDSGSSSYSIQLKPGTYNAEVTAAGYKKKLKSINIIADSATDVIQLEKNIDVKITGFGASFPDGLFVGETREVQVTLQNDSSSSVEVKLIAGDAIKGMAAASQVTVPGNSTQTATVTITVPQGTEVKDERSGDRKKASLRVKFTNESASKEFTLYPNPVPGIEVSKSVQFRLKAIEGQNNQSKRIRITNRNNFPIDDLQLSVEITSAPENGREAVNSWFQFTEIADEPEPWKISIDTIAGGKYVEKELQVIVPLTAEKETGIKGNIVLDASYFSQPLNGILTLDITEKASYGLELSLYPSTPYSIKWDNDQSKYEEKIVTLTVRNSGQITLENVVFMVENPSICSSTWLTFLESEISSLAPGAREELRLNVTVPISARGDEKTTSCNLRYWYTDPVQPDQRAEESVTSFLQITPKAD